MLIILNDGTNLYWSTPATSLSTGDLFRTPVL